MDEQQHHEELIKGISKEQKLIQSIIFVEQTVNRFKFSSHIKILNDIK